MEKDKEELLTKSLNFGFALISNININDIRFLSIIMHQYLEYYIDGIIQRMLRHPDKILNDLNFDKKCKLLIAFGFFDEVEGKKLLVNIKLMNMIRNHYAHHMDVSLGEEIPPRIKKHINSMIELGKADSEPIDRSDLVEWFRNQCFLTIAELGRINIPKAQ